MKNLPLASISKTTLRSTTIVLAFAILFGTLAARSVQAQTLTVLYRFRGYSDIFPYAGLVRDSAGNLYGTTAGTACTAPTTAYGTVFKVDPSGTQTVLHTFNFSDGACPFAPLIRDAEGNLYGTTDQGGAFGYGTVFKLDPSGKETVLHSFNQGTADGYYPSAGLLRDEAGNLYGTTENGGASEYGTVFKLDTSGIETILHNFAGADGEFPYSGLIMDANGNLYGTTPKGGIYQGVLYKLSKSGKFTLLHSFAGNGDGCYPGGTPFMDQKGNLYGTTGYCGASGYGTVFKFDTSGKETVLHSFAGGTKDGAYPIAAGVLMDREGNLYGDTEMGGGTGCGGYGCGTVYKLNKKGTLILLHTFTVSEGEYPFGDLSLDPKGNSYGTASQGGRGCQGLGCGTVWKLTQ